MKIYWLNESGWGHVWALVRAESLAQAKEVFEAGQYYSHRGTLVDYEQAGFREVSLEGPAEILFVDNYSPDTG